MKFRDFYGSGVLRMRIRESLALGPPGLVLEIYIRELLTALPSHTLEEIASEINRTEAKLDVTRRKTRLTSSTNLPLTRGSEF